MFFVVSFVPAVVTPLVAAAHAAGDEELVKKRVRDALWISAVIGAAAARYPNARCGFFARSVKRTRS